MKQFLLPLFCVCHLLAAATITAANIQPTHLRCEYRQNPLGMDVTLPRLSWTLEAAPTARGLTQSAYRVLVASTAERLAGDQGDLWDSGKVESDQQIHVQYAGKALTSRARCYWKVCVWDKDGQASTWSAPATWTMGLLQASDWRAQWIADPESVPKTNGVLTTVKPDSSAEALPATMVRKSFQLDRPIKRATAYASGLGLYELHLNGQRVGEELLTPEWTSYRKRVQYQVHDVTALLRPGENAVAALVGEGWFAGRLMAVGRFAYGTQPRFLLQLEVELADGQTQTIVSDGSWRCTTNGPIRSAGIYDGEVYDARKEMPGWDAPGFDASSWRPAQCLELDSRRLIWQRNEPIQVVREIAPIKMTEPKPGVFVFDLGQNMVGWCRVKVTGAAGHTVTLRHAEMLNDDGTIYTANLRGAPQIDRYTPRADGEFVFEPHFTYHGFRFAELTGLAAPPATNAVTGRVFHSTSPIVGRFECSDPSLNQLMQNILWTQR
ncbi:MAG: family 78 glycoside hydrolase catalytic domain, partial [Verrucomicrobia bacterium]|nr:family 78 glycoside hydrolase catalytic domain [Verrucomicrobiota bacterium]